MKGLKLDLMTILVLFVVASVFVTMASGFGDGKKTKVGVNSSFQGRTPEVANTLISAGNTAVKPGAAAESNILRASSKAVWN